MFVTTAIPPGVSANSTRAETAGLATRAFASRDFFPLLAKNPSLIYLDSAATAQRPQAVIDAEMRFYTQNNANVHRGLYDLSAEATEQYESARGRVARFLGARSPRSIIFTRGTTESINLAVQMLSVNVLRKGDSVLLSDAEHHSNLVPWQLAARRVGFGLKFLPLRTDGSVDTGRIEDIWDSSIRVVSLAQIGNAFGTVIDIAGVVDYAHKRGARVLVDAAQSVGRLPMDVTRLDCDFLAFSGHKVYGPTGIGVLYGKEELLEQFEPVFGGGEMISSVGRYESSWNDIPWKFEPGTPPIAQAIGLAAALDFVDELGVDRIGAHEKELGELACTLLNAINGVHVIAPLDRGSGIVSFVMEQAHPHDIAQYLNESGIAVRAGNHCAQPAMKAMGLNATVRLSAGAYTTRSEIQTCAAAVARAGAFFTHGTR